MKLTNTYRALTMCRCNVTIPHLKNIFTNFRHKEREREKHQ